MPHIISSRVTQYQAQAITRVTICQKFINSLIIRYGAWGIGHWLFIHLLPAPCSPASSSPLPYPFHKDFNSELVNSWL
jgi:hypothetical protein